MSKLPHWMKGDFGGDPPGYLIPQEKYHGRSSADADRVLKEWADRLNQIISDGSLDYFEPHYYSCSSYRRVMNKYPPKWLRGTDWFDDLLQFKVLVNLNQLVQSQDEDALIYMEERMETAEGIFNEMREIFDHFHYEEVSMFPTKISKFNIFTFTIGKDEWRETSESLEKYTENVEILNEPTRVVQKMLNIVVQNIESCAEEGALHY